MQRATTERGRAGLACTGVDTAAFGLEADGMLGPNGCIQRLLQNAGFLSRLRAMIAQRARDAVERQDLRQEALVHLWHVARDTPDRTERWYLRSCELHLRDLRKVGRSVDAPKRRAALVRWPLGAGADTEVPQPPAWIDSEAPAELSARDLIAALAQRLATPDRAVLRLRLQGHSLREVARPLSVSHQTARRRLARSQAVAIQIGLKPQAK